MPPKVAMDQAVKFEESLARGTPNQRKIALTVAADRFENSLDSAKYDVKSSKTPRPLSRTGRFAGRCL